MVGGNNPDYRQKSNITLTADLSTKQWKIEDSGMIFKVLKEIPANLEFCILKKLCQGWRYTKIFEEKSGKNLSPANSH